MINFRFSKFHHTDSGLLKLSRRFSESKSSWRLIILGSLALLMMVAFMTINTNGIWSFILPFRGTKLAVMVLVAFSIAVSTVLFQTITHNRILTPSLIGFDALYALIHSMAALGFGHGLASLNSTSPMQFIIQVIIMTGLACLLFKWIFEGSVHSLHKLILVGIIFGLLFRSLSNFVMRLIDPNEFLILQDRLFASFNSVNPNLLAIAAITLFFSTLLAFRILPRYDVLALGRHVAISLGINYQRTVMLSLALIAIMVSVSTALVGPITFLGLLVSNLAYHFSGSERHRIVLPAAVFIAIILLVGGETLLEHVLGLETSVSVVIEFIGGIMFLLIITKRVRQ
ncbi:iron chelate uptake ABC transporter family permease subunit [Acinetobacter baumannii]|nr:iron chelate uptake ABC transporter family permease subunit [Acinetobacter baumannii]